MPPLKYILLALSALGITLGLVAPSDLRLLDYALPIGAALFGMFLIVQALSRESALADQQQDHAGQPKH